jgi:hypothetical protein
MAKELEKKLLKELSRFKEINHNTQNLDEQIVSNKGNLGMGSHIDRLAKRFNMDEQEEPEAETEEIPVDPEAETEAIPAADEEGGGEAIPAADEEGGGEEMDMDMDIESSGEEMDMDIDTGEEDTTELDVTDLVTKQDEVNTELSDQKDILSKNTQSLDDLMDKLSDLESHLTSMDDMVEKISNLENKIEEYRPRTPEEKIGLRKYDSGPYSQNPSDFFNPIFSSGVRGRYSSILFSKLLIFSTISSIEVK